MANKPVLAWAEQTPDDDRMSRATERHYSPAEIAELWGVHRTKVARMFRDVDGVLKIGRDKYLTLRIPASVLEQYHADRSRGFGLKVKGHGYCRSELPRRQ